MKAAIIFAMAFIASNLALAHSRGRAPEESPKSSLDAEFEARVEADKRRQCAENADGRRVDIASELASVDATPVVEYQVEPPLEDCESRFFQVTAKFKSGRICKMAYPNFRGRVDCR